MKNMKMDVFTDLNMFDDLRDVMKNVLDDIKSMFDLSGDGVNEVNMNVLDDLSDGMNQGDRNVLDDISNIFDLSDEVNQVKRNAHVLNDVRNLVNWMMVTEMYMYNYL